MIPSSLTVYGWSSFFHSGALGAMELVAAHTYCTVHGSSYWFGGAC